MMTRREARAARLADAERSDDVASGERFPDALAEGTRTTVDAAQGNVERKSHAGPLHHADVTQATTLEQIAALPVVIHPLRLFLIARGVPITHAARVVGVDRRQLTKWFAWKARPTPRRSAEIARLLGFGGALDDDLGLFPRR
jgi:hypothetical protein